MSTAKWATPAAVPYGFRITIERRSRATGKLEIHIFERKTSNRSIAQNAALYKYGFLRLISIEPLAEQGKVAK